MAKAKTEAQAPSTVDETLATAGADQAPVLADTPAPADEAPAGPKMVRARVLAFCALGAPNDVIDIDADQVEKLGDVIDTHPAAVAYAESLKA